MESLSETDTGWIDLDSLAYARLSRVESYS